MLVPFTMSPLCVYPVGNDTPSARARVKELYQLWKQAGVLVVDDSERLVVKFRSQLGDGELPGWLRRLWQDIFLEMRHRVMRVPGWNGPYDGKACEAQEILPAQSLFIHLSERGLWGFGDYDSRILISEQVEVCRLDCLPDSRFASAIHSSSRSFKKKSPTIEVLALFDLASLIAKSVVIIDPYMGKEEVLKPGKSGGRRFVEYILSKRGPSSELQSLTLYTAKDVARSMRDQTSVGREEILNVWKAVRRSIMSDKLTEFRLCLVDGKEFAGAAHDRFVRFGDFAMQVGAGFAVFEGKRLSKQTAILTVGVESPKDLEGELRKETSFEENCL